MENASKALIMAGGLLIVVMIISIAMYVLTSARGIASDSNKQIEANAQASYNRFYESYSSQITGIDVLNIYNKVQDDNTRHTSIRKVNITITPSTAGEIGKLTAANGVSFMDDPYTYECKDNDGDGYIDTITISKI